MTTDADGGKTINAVNNAVRILDELLVCETAGVTELSEAVDLSKSTVHHYLTTLRRHDFVQQVDSTYRLGLRPLSYGGVARERESVFRTGKDGVDRLAADTGETARLVVERNGDAITLYQSSERPHEEVHTTLGTREDLHSTAAGKVMLAALGDPYLDSYLEGGQLTRHTRNTIVNPAALREEITDVRSRGIAFDDEEQFDGVRCVSTALVTESGNLLGALSVSSLTADLTDEAFAEELPRTLRNIAGVIEINTTYHGWVE